jgi:hypothetical protein
MKKREPSVLPELASVDPLSLGELIPGQRHETTASTSQPGAERAR